MLALEEPIDSDTAAAGDTVAAQVTSAVRENASRTVIIPAGSKVQCRVVRMEHRLD
jgi:type IV secretory pathway VirB10-like protein